MNSLKNLIAKTAGIRCFDYYYGTNVANYLQLFNDSLSWSKDKLENYQINKISKLLEYAYKNTSFYKRRFDEAGFDYKNFKYLDQLKKVPPLTRKDLQENLDDIISKEFDLSKCRKGSSSGSTGNPVIYYHDMDDFSAGRAAGIFGKMLGGYRLGDKWFNIWGNPTAVNVEWKKLSSRFSKFIFNEFRVAAYKLSNNSEFEKLIDNLLRIRPKFIYGYTNAIYLLSEHLREKSIIINFVSGVFTTAENLHEYQRKNIEEYIGKVFDQYGSSEINGVASQSKYSDNYLILEPHVLVEYGSAVVGTESRKLIITNFDNKVLPFIRYENGDLAEPEVDIHENSKINFHELKKVDGRVSDIIKLPGGGSLVVPSFFGSRMLKNVKGIKQYQIVKKESDKIKINLLTTSAFRDDYKNIILNTLEEYIPKELKFDLVFNEEIHLSKNGKFKLFLDETKLN